MTPRSNAGGARSTPPAPHDEARRESLDLPPAMAALGGDYIAELAAIDPPSVAPALERLASVATATYRRARAWRLFRRDYQAQAMRLRSERLLGTRGAYGRGQTSTAERVGEAGR